jgi:hypothetical protein
MDYSLSIKKCYGTLPIVLAVVVHNTSQELSGITSECQEFPFARKLPCTGWAKDCFLINKQTVSDHLENKPLEPLVALAHFLIEGKSALVNMEKGDDETIKKLYTIAKQIVSHEILNEKTSTTAFEELYCHAINGLNQTKEILLETPNTEATNKRAIDCLDSYIKALGNIHKKRFEETPTDNCETLSVESASTLDAPSLIVSISATISIPSLSRGLKRKDKKKLETH